MKANEFVKKFGFEHAKYLLEDTTLEYFAVHSQCAGKYFEDTVCVNDLKRLVESHELVESFGGLDAAKKELNRLSVLRWINPETEKLRAAIADVESCQ
ncbi:hypothetical protein [Acinetobacter sp. YH16053]|uniref:hypothetical protein n=1 Tax=Acinetobacter sp. YH16053 TaxID=2601192 RepID=UPI0015D22837|nr:hypothetical protein [Acinetobacter sp. YH16053]